MLYYAILFKYVNIGRVLKRRYKFSRYRRDTMSGYYVRPKSISKFYLKSQIMEYRYAELTIPNNGDRTIFISQEEMYRKCFPQEATNSQPSYICPGCEVEVEKMSEKSCNQSVEPVEMSSSNTYHPHSK
jgi:hypothetical protein